MPILPDVLCPGLSVVFCGSGAGAASARRGAYYAGPGNRFWPTLFRIGLTPRLLDPREFQDGPSYGFGLTDLCKTASGADRDLPPSADDPADLRRKVEHFAPGMLAFAGKRAAAITLARPVDYGPQPETIGSAAAFVLPSPSGAARRYWDEAPWFRLAAILAT